MIDSIELAKNSRLLTLELITSSKSSHIGSSFSVIDILAVLYSRKLNENRKGDTVIFSKGHAAAGFYSILANLKLIDKSLLLSYCKDGSLFGGHVTHTATSEVKFSTGSLGHGLPFATGIAYSNKIDNLDKKIYVLISDGECDEGTTWESALFASHHSLSNLCLIIDRNNLQSLKTTEETLKLEPFSLKWEAFGWQVNQVDGHSHENLKAILNKLDYASGKPQVIIANTIKGKGVSFMENKISWHYKTPTQDEFNIAKSEIMGK